MGSRVQFFFFRIIFLWPQLLHDFLQHPTNRNPLFEPSRVVPLGGFFYFFDFFFDVFFFGRGDDGGRERREEGCLPVVGAWGGRLALAEQRLRVQHRCSIFGSVDEELASVQLDTLSLQAPANHILIVMTGEGGSPPAAWICECQVGGNGKLAVSSGHVCCESYVSGKLDFARAFADFFQTLKGKLFEASDGVAAVRGGELLHVMLLLLTMVKSVWKATLVCCRTRPQ